MSLPLSTLQVCSFYLTRFKDFKVLCTWSLSSPPVKGLDTFWRVRGLIGGFNKPRGNIASGVEKTEYYLMSVINFCTTPKGDIQHCYYIFMRLDTMGMELNNVMCSRLGNMLYLEIQRGGGGG